MMPRLPAGKPIGPGLVRMATRLVRDAASRLGANRELSTDDVHDARVALKRTRSILRLLERAGADWAHMPRLRLADLARELSAARESAVAAGLAARMRRQRKDARRELADHLLQNLQPAAVGDPGYVGAALRREADLLAYAPLPVITRAALKSYLRRSLERADGCHQAVAARPDRERVHEWRKQVIVLRDQTGLAAAAWPAGAGRAHRILVTLARELGGIGDLVQLEARFTQLPVPASLRASRRVLVAELGTERKNRTAVLIRRWPVQAARLGRQLG